MYIPTALPTKLRLSVQKYFGIFALFCFVSTVLCYWVYIREDVQTGTTVKGITAGCLLGVTTHCIRTAQVLFDSYTVASECDQAKYELEKPMMACLMYKHAVEDALPAKKKILHVVDNEIPKCKND